MDWTVACGKGGSAGRHETPGAGGPGGRGGKSHSWKEHTGWKWSCSSECGTSNSSALTTTRNSSASNQVALSGLRNDRGLYFAFPTGAISDGTNVAQVNNVAGYIPASIAPQFREALLQFGGTSNAMTSYNRSSCTSSGHASSCRQVKTYTSRYRPGAANGANGRPGEAPTGPVPQSGKNGKPGTVAIVIVKDDGTESCPYSARLKYQLVDFDVVDENNDGIFEPGECAIIKNIKVKNNAPRGAMPTPRRTRIPVRLAASQYLAPRNALELPFGIEPGETQVVQGEIWADISVSEPDSLETPLRIPTTIKLEATFPDINRIVPRFDCSKDIDIRHPLELVGSGFKFLDSLAPGTSTSVQWQVTNISE